MVSILIRATSLALLCLNLISVNADSGLGCFSSISVAEDMGSNTWQSTGQCSGKCASYPYYALKGNECYCLNSVPSSSISSSSCDISCDGWSADSCGGSNAYNVFKGKGTASSSAGSSSSTSQSSSSTQSGESTSSSASSSSSSSESTKTSGSSDKTSSQSTTSAPSTTSSSKSSTEAATSSDAESDSSDSATEVLTTVTSSHSQAVETKSVTVSASSTSKSTSSTTGSSKSNNGSNKSKTNVGAIAGGVVGGFVGLLAILGIIFFFWRRSNNDEDDEEEINSDKPTGMMKGPGSSRKFPVKQSSLLDRPMSNPFSDPSERNAAAAAAAIGAANTNSGLVDPRLNPMMMGRRRLSDNSLADEADYSRKILQVANPDVD